MVISQTMVVDAERAEGGAMCAVEVGAEMSGSFFAMGEAGDYPGSEGVVVHHGCLLLKLYSTYKALRK